MICNFHLLLLVLSTLGIENRLLLFATPFYDLKTYCIWLFLLRLKNPTLVKLAAIFHYKEWLFSAFLLPLFLHNTTFVIPAIAPMFLVFSSFCLSPFFLLPSLSVKIIGMKKKHKEFKSQKPKRLKTSAKNNSFFFPWKCETTVIFRFSGKKPAVFCHLNTQVRHIQQHLKKLLWMCYYFYSMQK